MISLKTKLQKPKAKAKNNKELTPSWGNKIFPICFEIIF